MEFTCKDPDQHVGSTGPAGFAKEPRARPEDGEQRDSISIGGMILKLQDEESMRMALIAS